MGAKQPQQNGKGAKKEMAGAKVHAAAAEAVCRSGWSKHKRKEKPFTVEYTAVLLC